MSQFTVELAGVGFEGSSPGMMARTFTAKTAQKVRVVRIDSIEGMHLCARVGGRSRGV